MKRGLPECNPFGEFFFLSLDIVRVGGMMKNFSPHKIRFNKKVNNDVNKYIWGGAHGNLFKKKSIRNRFCLCMALLILSIHLFATSVG